MLFTTLEYLIFFLLAAAAHHLTPGKHRWAVTVLAGLAFVSWASPIHAVAAVGMAAVNYGTAIAVDRWAETPRGTRFLWLALILDVGVLAYFKYQGFFVENVNALGGALGHSPGLHARAVLLPLGISYYTFQLIGYNLEVHWGREAPERHFGRFLASVLFFPKLVAGPIERPHRFFGQTEKKATSDDVVIGLRRIGWGLFKKVVIADRVALFVDLVYQRPTDLHGLPLLVGIGLYTVQVYCDFSGYTDIALGSARVLGVELSPNFDRPFSARSITDFWRRWHISLSSWTNDYIYKPLSMWVSLSTRWGLGGVLLSVLVTFFVLGLWHGPRWSFVLFGLIHGAAVCLELLTQRPRAALAERLSPRAAALVANALTVGFYAFSCVFFRARTVREALHVVSHAFRGLGDLGSLSLFQPLAFHGLILAGLLALYLGYRLLGPRGEERRGPRGIFDYAMVMAIFVLGVFETNQFVYVQF